MKGSMSGCVVWCESHSKSGVSMLLIRCKWNTRPQLLFHFCSFLRLHGCIPAEWNLMGSRSVMLMFCDNFRQDRKTHAFRMRWRSIYWAIVSVFALAWTHTRKKKRFCTLDPVQIISSLVRVPVKIMVWLWKLQSKLGQLKMFRGVGSR